MENARRWKQKEYLEIYPYGCKLPRKMGVFGDKCGLNKHCPQKSHVVKEALKDFKEQYS